MLPNLNPNALPLPFHHNGVTQVGILVPDLDAAVEYYHRLFDIGPWHFYTYERPLVSEMTYRGEPADYSMRIALSHFGTTRIELIQPVRGPSLYDEFIEAHGYGVQHFGLYVPSMTEALEQARAAELSVLMDGRGFGPDGDGWYAYLNTEAMLGITLELIERPARRHPPEKVYPAE
ncbi:MAG: hypothetical protein GX484_06375 [Chloroflexi bacterium]|nr:hypothetical protein [Chloroflexota bacterium]